MLCEYVYSSRGKKEENSEDSVITSLCCEKTEGVLDTQCKRHAFIP
jgi:hypothetical protein